MAWHIGIVFGRAGAGHLLPRVLSDHGVEGSFKTVWVSTHWKLELDIGDISFLEEQLLKFCCG